MVDLYSDVGKLIVSGALGMAVGLERELSDKPAGLKTNVLICMGSALFTMMSMHWFGVAGMDAHIAAQIVSGIGFLGAGAIMREGEHVTGLTTAATIWIVAAIGMTVGMSHYTLAAMATLGTLLVQVAMTPLDVIVDDLRQRHNFKIVTGADEAHVEQIARLFKTNGIHIMRRKVMKKDRLYHSEWWTSGSQTAQEKAMREMLKAPNIIEVSY